MREIFRSGQITGAGAAKTDKTGEIFAIKGSKSVTVAAEVQLDKRPVCGRFKMPGFQLVHAHYQPPSYRCPWAFRGVP